MANPTLHPDIEVISGDDWAIAGNLTDLDGGPLDLTDAVLTWVLTDPNGAVATSFPGTAAITVWPGVPGSITISLDRDVTEFFEPGRYNDQLRVAVAGLNDVMWRGCLLVGANLFAVRPQGWPAPLPWPLPPGPKPYWNASGIAVGSPHIDQPTLVENTLG
jgi:hypothetical protein